MDKGMGGAHGEPKQTGNTMQGQTHIDQQRTTVIESDSGFMGHLRELFVENKKYVLQSVLVAQVFISSLSYLGYLIKHLKQFSFLRGVIVFVFIIHLASWDNGNPIPFPTMAFRFMRKINCEMNILADRHSTCDKSSTCHVLDVKVITSHCCTHGT